MTPALLQTNNNWHELEFWKKFNSLALCVGRALLSLFYYVHPPLKLATSNVAAALHSMHEVHIYLSSTVLSVFHMLSCWQKDASQTCLLTTLECLNWNSSHYDYSMGFFFYLEFSINSCTTEYTVIPHHFRLWLYFFWYFAMFLC